MGYKYKISAVYMIRNKINNKVYIGSSLHYFKRIGAHKLALNKGFHHSLHLQRSWNKYGEDNFEFKIIEKVNVDDLIKREQYWMDYFNSYNYKKGYNGSPSAGSNLGFVMSEETKKKMSEKRKGRKQKVEGVLKRSGEKHYKAKLTKDQVLEIVTLLNRRDKTIKEIAQMYNVSPITVSRIGRGETWKEETKDLLNQNNIVNGQRKSKGSSKYKGVTVRYSKKDNTPSFRSWIYLNGKRINLGEYSSEMIAANVYNHKALELFGENAYVNNVENIPLEECEKYRLKPKKKSKYLGIAYDNRHDYWYARIDKTHIGGSKNEIDAVKMYNQKAIEIYGENYSKLNKDENGKVII